MQARIQNLLVWAIPLMSAYCIYLAWLSFKIDKDQNGMLRQRCHSLYTATPVFMLFAVLSLLDMNKSVDYREFVDVYKHTVNTRSGVIRYEDTPLNDPKFANNFPFFTPPAFSILLRESEKGTVINVPSHVKWQPFPAEHLPDLSRYYKNGINP